ncbi:MAG TPA: c-type cytochrome [Kofleriaceae bacterium]|jgi:cytochrome c oxidase cbb3-type subunit 2|nr:c-type cytochrome [Kofleriaceae bacterium]
MRTLIICLLLAGCAPRPALHIDPADWNRASAAEGRALFRAVCAGCHGDDGRAATPAAAVYFPAPRDLTRGEFRFRTTASGTLPLRDDLVRTLHDGLPGTAMPAWGDQLSVRQLMSLVLYVQTLSPRFADPDEEVADEDILVRAAALQPPPDSAALRTRGRALYQQLKCHDCHGDAGRGDGPSAPTARNQDGTRGHVFDFTYGVYKGGNRPIDVYRTFMTGLDGTPMPSYADSIPAERDRWALVYYVLSLSRPRGFWFYLRERPTWRDPATCR